MIASVRTLIVSVGTLMTLYANPLPAASFVFTPLVLPKSNYSAYLSGIYRDQVVGSGYTTKGGEVGFTWSAGKYTIVSAVNTFAAVSDNGLAVGFAKGSNTSYVTYNLVTGEHNAFQFAPSQGTTVSLSNINSAGVVSATQRVQTGIHSYTCQAFVQSPDGSYSIIDPAKDELVSLGVTDSGVVLVAKTSSRECPDTAYSVDLYRNGKLKKYSIANGRDVNLFFVEGDGVFGGNYINTVANDIEGFTATGGKSVSYSVPGNNTTTVTSEGPPGQYAGYSVDASGNYHGFLYIKKTYYSIDYPGANSTIITGYSSTGAIIGYFGDGGLPGQPFVATCASDQGCTN